MDLNNIFTNLKYLKASDFVAPLILTIAYPIAAIVRLYFRLQNKRVWLLADSSDTARDNGYYFFSYLAREHPEIDSYYAIIPTSPDAERIRKISPEHLIPYGSFKHWVYYLAAEFNISSQKAANPAPALFYLLRIYKLIPDNFIFLQHGITINDTKWLYYNKTGFRLFICGARREYKYIVDNFGYPPDRIVYTGFARYDSLSEEAKTKKQLLIMPTWRQWLARDVNVFGSRADFQDSEYFRAWSEILNDKTLQSLLEKHNYTAIFYPHYNMQKYIKHFNVGSKLITIADTSNADIQQLIKESAIMITDYSSVFFDFSYLKKPTIYYQFDEYEYRAKQYETGYFSYRKHGFGDVLCTKEAVVNSLSRYFALDCKIEKKYSDRIVNFFENNDNRNCDRIYNAIIGI